MSAISAPSTLDTKWLRRLWRARRARGLGRHRRPQIRTADADIDHIGHGLSERAAQASLAHVTGESSDLGALRDDFGHHILALDENGRAGEIAQCRVQRGAALGGVDDIAAEHRLPLAFDIGGLGERFEMGERRARQALFRIIEQEIVQRDMHRSKTRQIGPEFVQDAATEGFVLVKPSAANAAVTAVSTIFVPSFRNRALQSRSESRLDCRPAIKRELKLPLYPTCL